LIRDPGSGVRGPGSGILPLLAAPPGTRNAERRTRNRTQNTNSERGTWNAELLGGSLTPIRVHHSGAVDQPAVAELSEDEQLLD
jgi:hypothetical protein